MTKDIDKKILDLMLSREEFQDSITRQNLPSKKIILRECEVSRNMIGIEKGSMRLSFNNDGKDVTFQFFFEGDIVSSLESFKSDEPSLFNIETLEPCTIITIDKENLKNIIKNSPEIKEIFNEYVYNRLISYQKLFLSRIKDTPQQRYEESLNKSPNIIQRIPQHYIASFLGITSVSLSRIRNRIR